MAGIGATSPFVEVPPNDRSPPNPNRIIKLTMPDSRRVVKAVSSAPSCSPCLIERAVEQVEEAEAERAIRTPPAPRSAGSTSTLARPRQCNPLREASIGGR